MTGILNVLLIIGAVLFMVFFFGMCVFVHELGHFLAAKWRGLHIVAFSIGFKKVWSKTYHGVEYRIGCIPCGGYVDLPQIDSSSDEKVVDGVTLPPAKPIDRIITAAAGPLFNILFGLLLGVLVWYYGIPASSPKMSKIVVASVEAGSPEYRAGLRPGDVIVKLNGKTFHENWQRFVSDVIFTVGEVKLTVKRDGKTFDIGYVPAANLNVMKQERIAVPFFQPLIPLKMYPREGSLAEQAGIRPGDILLAVNGRPVADFYEIHYLLGERDRISMLVRRDGKDIEITGIVPKREVVADVYQLGVMFASTKPPTLEKVLPGSPAEKAGLKVGEQLLRIDNRPIDSTQQAIKLIAGSGGRTLTLELLDHGKTLSRTVIPTPQVSYDIGVDFAAIEHPTPWQQLSDVVIMTGNAVRGIAYYLAHKAGVSQQSSTLKPSNLSGPLGIGRLIFQSVYHGSLIQGFYVIVMITFSLGLLNIMPIPVLDGGHIVMALLEMIFRRPVPARILQPVYVFFITFLILFMIYVTVYDVFRFLPDSATGAAGKEVETEKSPAAATTTKPTEAHHDAAPAHP
ncbi:MAG: site-2 protease family protein [Victivallales bacterium]|nr:site-2 protease family protein [Victivallales bacterium]